MKRALLIGGDLHGKVMEVDEHAHEIRTPAAPFGEFHASTYIHTPELCDIKYVVYKRFASGNETSVYCCNAMLTPDLIDELVKMAIGDAK